MNKKRISSIIIVTVLILTLIGTAATTTINKVLEYSDIGVYIRGTNTANAYEKITPTDANGADVEPFTMDGTTYLPVRAIGEALGLDVKWDNATNSVYLNGFSNYYRNNTDYDTFPITMRMQAGHNENNQYSGGGSTLLSGEGYIDPFGVGSYHAGFGYPEEKLYPLDQYVSDWMIENFNIDMFCIYHFADGDIYAWDGILGAITSDTGTGSADREDALINIIVGGTGAYQGATGMLVGRTLGAGEYAPVSATMSLPQALFKNMEGHIRIPKDASGYTPPAVTQKLGGASSGDDVDYVTIPLEMNMKAGCNEFEPWTSGFWTIHSGIGFLEPFGQGSYHAGRGYAEEENFSTSDFFNDNFMDVFSPTLFCIYHTDYGDIYVYDGLWSYMLKEDSETSGKVGTTAQRQDALINVIIGGTEAFEGASGILVGRTLGAGDYQQCGYMPEQIVGTADTVPYTLPETLLKQMSGYINVRADSAVAGFAK